MGFTRRTLAADCEISTGKLSVYQLPPIFVGEAGALDVDITLKLNGQAYTPTGVTATMHLYWPGTNLQTEYVQMTVNGNVVSGRFANFFTTVPGSPLLVVRIKEDSTDDIIVVTATPIRIWKTGSKSIIDSKSSVKSVNGQEPNESGDVALPDYHIPSSIIAGQDTVALALAYLNTSKANASKVYTKTEVDTALDLKANQDTTYTKTEVDTALSEKANQSTTYTKTEVDTALDLKANQDTTYTKTEVDTALSEKANQSTTYTKTEVDALVSALFRYKGNKATYADIQAITTKAIGDVWFCEADSSEYAWDGSKWEKLGPVIDMSAYLTQLSIAGLTIDSSHFTITAAQLRTALDIYTKSEVDTALDLKANQSTTYTKTEVDTALSAKANQDTTYTKTEVNTALDLKADQATTYTKSEVDALVSSLFRYKGSKATYSEIQAIITKAIGDVWFCSEDSSEYVWTGTAWEKLGPVISGIMPKYLTQSIAVADWTLSGGVYVTDISNNVITDAMVVVDLDFVDAENVPDRVTATVVTGQHKVRLSTPTIPEAAVDVFVTLLSVA